MGMDALWAFFLVGEIQAESRDGKYAYGEKDRGIHRLILHSRYRATTIRKKPKRTA